jgi:hypothetical protein
MRLTQVPIRHIWQSLFEHPVRDKHFNPDEGHMGSTPYGNANPMTLIGLALPQDIEINRAGYVRVRGDGRA